MVNAIYRLQVGSVRIYTPRMLIIARVAGSVGQVREAVKLTECLVLLQSRAAGDREVFPGQSNRLLIRAHFKTY